ncbi:DUF4386 domain-containing protein [Amycolatopsis japonica]|uniref:DUF4386 domain-containing protein n=1 Tax=Amycolatopsis japonica TaxID=208439 RepID=UPI0033F19471
MSSASPEVTVERPIRTASITAGIGLLFMAALAGFGKFVAVDGLVTPGDAAQTARDITESAGLFRLGIASLFLVIALDVVVAWGLYRVFSPVSRNLSLIAAAFRLVYSGVFLVAIGQLFGPLRLFADDAYLGVFSVDQLNSQALLEIAAFSDLWMMSLGLFGIHLLALGYLAYRSGYVPRVLGVLLVIAGLGYVIDSFGVMLYPGGWTDVSTYTFLGEFLLALWLVIWGRRVTSIGSPELNRE